MTQPARPDPLAAHNLLRRAIVSMDPKRAVFTIADLSQFTDALLDALALDGSVLVNAEILARIAVVAEEGYLGERHAPAALDAIRQDLAALSSEKEAKP